MKPWVICRKIFLHPVSMFLIFIMFFIAIVYILSAINSNRKKRQKLKVKKFPGKRRFK